MFDEPMRLGNFVHLQSFKWLKIVSNFNLSIKDWATKKSANAIITERVVDWKALVRISKTSIPMNLTI
jgi:hypothetical protein